MDKAYAVILAGGKGERFWPLSTSKKPKQLLSLVGDKPLIAQAVDRLEGLIPADRVYVITNADLVDATREAAPQIPAAQIIGEPMGRDTAAAAALGCLLVKQREPDASFCILTADHVIGDLDLFRQTLRESLELALEQDVLITIGIQPAEPSTGFGYIEAGNPLKRSGRIDFLKAKRFVEKPDLDTARTYVESGSYFWNAGMFIWSVRALESAMQKHCPHLMEMYGRLAAHAGADDFMDAVRDEYEKLKKISIDYALMEKADNIVMARGVFTWDDVGAWPALENHFRKDAQGNVAVGDCQTVDASGNIVISGGRLTALIGVEDLVVVQADGVTLVCDKSRAQDVKKMVEQIKATGQYDRLI